MDHFIFIKVIKSVSLYWSRCLTRRKETATGNRTCYLITSFVVLCRIRMLWIIDAGSAGYWHHSSPRAAPTWCTCVHVRRSSSIHCRHVRRSSNIQCRRYIYTTRACTCVAAATSNADDIYTQHVNARASQQQHLLQTIYTTCMHVRRQDVSVHTLPLQLLPSFRYVQD